VNDEIYIPKIFFVDVALSLCDYRYLLSYIYIYIYTVDPSTKSIYICCVDCKLLGVPISDKTLLGTLRNRDLELSTVDSIVKEQIRSSGDKL
jgi:hypothetical protein